MLRNKKKTMTTTEGSQANNLIGKGTSLEGNLTTAGNLRVEGNVKGSIHAKAKVVLSETAVVDGDLMAQHAEIGGTVQGKINITGLLILKPTAVVDGDLVTHKLIFEEGARFNGKCSMNGTADKSSLLKEIKRKSSSTPLPQPVPVAQEEK